MKPLNAEQLDAAMAVLRRQGDALPKDDPAARLRHLAQIHAIAMLLNAKLPLPEKPTE
jgi:hypothetical protein